MVKHSGKRSKQKTKRPRDVNQLAQYMVRLSTGQEPPEQESNPTDSEISRVMAALGRKGGKIGGRKRAEGMTAERRREIALMAARSRWDKKR